MEKVHIQTLINSDPDFLDQNEKPTLQELICNHIMFTEVDFSDYYKTPDLLVGQIKKILYDSEDDKLGRIRDLYDKEIEGLAKFIAEHHKENNFARWAYEEVISTVV